MQVRAGESEAEAQGYTLTNPVAKTSMTSGLSKRGKKQVSSNLRAQPVEQQTSDMALYRGSSTFDYVSQSGWTASQCELQFCLIDAS